MGAARVRVVVRRCFPWSEPGRYVSLRDADQAEVALVRDPADLTPASREALGLAMAEAGFVFEVTRDDVVRLSVLEGAVILSPQTASWAPVTYRAGEGVVIRGAAPPGRPALGDHPLTMAQRCRHGRSPCPGHRPRA